MKKTTTKNSSVRWEFPADGDRVWSIFVNKLTAVRRETLRCLFPRQRVLAQFVSWCCEPSQPQMITSGLNTNFNLSPSYSFRKSLHRKSLFLRPQLRFYPRFRNTSPEKQWHISWNLFIFNGHSTRKPVLSMVTCFILRAYTGTSVSHS